MVPTAMYSVFSGAVDCFNANTFLKTFSPGEMFLSSVLLHSTEQCTESYVSPQFSQLFYLSRKKFDQLLPAYPIFAETLQELRDRHREKFAQQKDQSKNLQRLKGKSIGLDSAGLGVGLSSATVSRAPSKAVSKAVSQANSGNSSAAQTRLASRRNSESKKKDDMSLATGELIFEKPLLLSQDEEPDLDNEQVLVSHPVLSTEQLKSIKQAHEVMLGVFRTGKAKAERDVWSKNATENQTRISSRVASRAPSARRRRSSAVNTSELRQATEQRIGKVVRPSSAGTNRKRSTGRSLELDAVSKLTVEKRTAKTQPNSGENTAGTCSPTKHFVGRGNDNESVFGTPTRGKGFTIAVGMASFKGPNLKSVLKGQTTSVFEPADSPSTSKPLNVCTVQHVSQSAEQVQNFESEDDDDGEGDGSAERQREPNRVLLCIPRNYWDLLMGIVVRNPRSGCIWDYST